jgi:DNA-binding transcriptional MerR regulator
MTIGALARRLRVSPRALRHYESLGLLRPSRVDARTGYRFYGDAELARGLQIEQLKAAGLPLATIAHILDDAVPLVEALDAHRSRLVGAIAEHRTHLSVVDAMLSAPDDSLAPALVEFGAVHAIVAEAECTPNELTGTIRRLVQRLRRERVRGLGVTPSTYSARFPLEPSAEPSARMATRVAAHLDSPCRGSVVIDAVVAVAVDVVGLHALLPLAQDAAVAEARARGLAPCGWVWEHYSDLGVDRRVDRGLDRARLPHSRLLLPVTCRP